MATKFQQRHYEAIAGVIQQARERNSADTEEAFARCVGIQDVEILLAHLFQNDNPLFNRGRFERACIPGANVRAHHRTWVGKEKPY